MAYGDVGGPVTELIITCKTPASGTIAIAKGDAVMLTGADGGLVGLFTDSDLARLFEQRRDSLLDRPIREVMTPNPITALHGTRVADAIEVLRRCKISELPVVDALGRPVGLIDITDLIGLVSAEEVDAVGKVA